ncbi:MAG TPA: YbhB/YbcL family Raf kinase inhibitor-like protein [Chloroflexota bacterium]|nr:YbhB/YbcL family Raf kinase inhibitor-like protein [Chloroflexota bacterium]
MKTLLALIAGVIAMATHNAFTLSSTTFPNNGKIPTAQAYNGRDCGGQNISPALAWSGVPSGTKSLALILFDPDARQGQGWTHWVAYGIDPARGSLPEGVKDGVTQGKTGFPTPGYGGPCPPVGDPPHHYVFTLYALDLAPSALQAGLDRDGLLNATKGHSIGTATYTGLYQRTK